MPGKNETNAARTRKAISTAIREACAELNFTCEVVADPTGQGRLMYSVGGSRALTPGEAATVLAIEGWS